jgi:hypothetical protein
MLPAAAAVVEQLFLIRSVQFQESLQMQTVVLVEIKASSLV